jgi:hypothetical protein
MIHSFLVGYCDPVLWHFIGKAAAFATPMLVGGLLVGLIIWLTL